MAHRLMIVPPVTRAHGEDWQPIKNINNAKQAAAFWLLFLLATGFFAFFRVIQLFNYDSKSVWHGLVWFVYSFWIMPLVGIRALWFAVQKIEDDAFETIWPLLGVLIALAFSFAPCVAWVPPKENFDTFLRCCIFLGVVGLALPVSIWAFLTYYTDRRDPFPSAPLTHSMLWFAIVIGLLTAFMLPAEPLMFGPMEAILSHKGSRRYSEVLTTTYCTETSQYHFIHGPCRNGVNFTAWHTIVPDGSHKILRDHYPCL